MTCRLKKPPGAGWAAAPLPWPRKRQTSVQRISSVAYAMARPLAPSTGEPGVPRFACNFIICPGSRDADSSAGVAAFLAASVP